MKSTNIVLLGIALILFGGVVTIVNSIYDIGELMAVFGVFAPFLGIIISAIGAFKND